MIIKVIRALSRLSFFYRVGADRADGRAMAQGAWLISLPVPPYAVPQFPIELSPGTRLSLVASIADIANTLILCYISISRRGRTQKWPQC